MRKRRRIVESISRNLATVITIHQGFMPEVEIVDESTARGVWAMEDYLESTDGSLAYRGVQVEGQRGIRGYGHYFEEYRLTDAGWRISHLLLTRIRIDPLVGAVEPVHSSMVPAPAGPWLPREGVDPASQRTDSAPEFPEE